MNTFNSPVYNGDIVEAALNVWIEGHAHSKDAQTFHTTSNKLKKTRRTHMKTCLYSQSHVYRNQQK